MTHKRIIERELEGFGIRLNQRPKNIIFRRKNNGGVAITCVIKLTHLDKQTILAIMKEYGQVQVDELYHIKRMCWSDLQYAHIVRTYCREPLQPLSPNLLVKCIADADAVSILFNLPISSIPQSPQL